MTTRWRILLELFAPPLLGAAILAWTSQHPDALPIWIVVGYTVGAIPCIIYTVVMEIAFREGLRPNSWKTVMLSMAATGGSALLTSVVFGDFPSDSALMLISLSLGVGLILGGLIKMLSPEKETATPTVPRRSWFRWEGTFVDED